MRGRQRKMHRGEKKIMAGIWPGRIRRKLWVEIKNGGLKMARFSGRWTY
jgi:hypothetical protein